MENSFFMITLITLSYLCIRFFEMKFINKDVKPLKTFIKEGFLVFSSSYIAYWLYDQMNSESSLNFFGGSDTPNSTNVFIDTPDF